MAVRSKQLFADANLGTGVVDVSAYTVPTGFRTILKSWNIRFTAALTYQIYVALANGQGNAALTSQTAGAAGETYADRWIVLNEGDVVHVTSTVGQSTRVILSGTELEL